MPGTRADSTILKQQLFMPSDNAIPLKIRLQLAMMPCWKKDEHQDNQDEKLMSCEQEDQEERSTESKECKIVDATKDEIHMSDS